MVNAVSMYRPSTYWPPGSWEVAGNMKMGMVVQAIWCVDGSDLKVHLQADVAEGGYLYDGVTELSNPTLLSRARKIDKFFTYPDLRSLKQVRIAVVT